MRGLVLVGVAACGYHPTAGDLPSSGDGPPPVDDEMTMMIGCAGTAIVKICPTEPPTGITILSGTIDTGGDLRCIDFTSSTATDACVIAAETINVGPLRAIGDKPLVLLATVTLAIEPGGGIDAASHVGSTGAGADSAACVAGTAAGTAGGSSGGGAGGTFGGDGGDGSPGELGGDGGVATETAGPPSALRGGCPGNPGAGTGAGGAGHGGGAVFLIAPEIKVAGTINASGGGGTMTAAGNNAGGGGGGSGGMIGFDTPSLSITGAAFANGGGGSEGGGGGVFGNPGGESPAATLAGPGGMAGGGGGDGGEGSAGAIDAADGKPASINDGGGGGGGGAGAIRMFGARVTGASIAPPPS